MERSRREDDLLVEAGWRLLSVVVWRVLGMDWQLPPGAREEVAGLRLRIRHGDGQAGGAGWNGLKGQGSKVLQGNWQLGESFPVEVGESHEQSLGRGIVRVE